jgi:hypothetical protein
MKPWTTMVSIRRPASGWMLRVSGLHSALNGSTTFEYRVVQDTQAEAGWVSVMRGERKTLHSAQRAAEAAYKKLRGKR